MIALQDFQVFIDHTFLSFILFSMLLLLLTIAHLWCDYYCQCYKSRLELAGLDPSGFGTRTSGSSFPSLIQLPLQLFMVSPLLFCRFLFLHGWRFPCDKNEQRLSMSYNPEQVRDVVLFLQIKTRFCWQPKCSVPPSRKVAFLALLMLKTWPFWRSLIKEIKDCHQN